MKAFCFLFLVGFVEGVVFASGALVGLLRLEAEGARLGVGVLLVRGLGTSRRRVLLLRLLLLVLRPLVLLLLLFLGLHRCLVLLVLLLVLRRLLVLLLLLLLVVVLRLLMLGRRRRQRVLLIGIRVGGHRLDGGSQAAGFGFIEMDLVSPGSRVGRAPRCCCCCCWGGSSAKVGDARQACCALDKDKRLEPFVPLRARYGDTSCLTGGIPCG